MGPVSAAWGWLRTRPVAPPASESPGCPRDTTTAASIGTQGRLAMVPTIPPVSISPRGTFSGGPARAARQSMPRRLAHVRVRTSCPLPSTADPGISSGWPDEADSPSSQTRDEHARQRGAAIVVPKGDGRPLCLLPGEPESCGTPGRASASASCPCQAGMRGRSGRQPSAVRPCLPGVGSQEFR